jgi:hypothetical protein
MKMTRRLRREESNVMGGTIMEAKDMVVVKNKY